MGMRDEDILSEFDPVDVEVEADGYEERAVLADPHLQSAAIVNPSTNLPEPAPENQRGLRWNQIPMPVRERAFFMWIELGDFTEVGHRLGMDPGAVKRLSKKDGWAERAEELRAGLEKVFSVQVLENRRRALHIIHDTLGELKPERLLALMDGKDLVKLLGMSLAHGGAGPGGGGLNVHTGDGPTQINFGSTRDGDKSLSDLSDEDLAHRARELGIDVQAAPRVIGAVPEQSRDLPPPLPEPDSGGTDQA